VSKGTRADGGKKAAAKKPVNPKAPGVKPRPMAQQITKDNPEPRAGQSGDQQ